MTKKYTKSILLTNGYIIYCDQEVQDLKMEVDGDVVTMSVTGLMVGPNGSQLNGKHLMNVENIVVTSVIDVTLEVIEAREVTKPLETPVSN